MVCSHSFNTFSYQNDDINNIFLSSEALKAQFGYAMGEKLMDIQESILYTTEDQKYLKVLGTFKEDGTDLKTFSRK